MVRTLDIWHQLFAAAFAIAAWVVAAGLAFAERPDIIWEVRAYTYAQQNHTEVDFVSFSPDGGVIVSDSLGNLKLWRTATGELMWLAPGDLYGPLYAGWAFSPDGRTIALNATSGEGVELYDVSTGRPICMLEGSKGVYLGKFVFSPDGSTIAATDGKGLPDTIKLWRTSDGKLMRTIEDSRSPLCVAFSPDGTLLAYGCYDGTLILARNPLAPLPSGTAPGDINGDGRVTVADALLALRIAIGLERGSTHQIAAGDLNGNGTLDLSDVTSILHAAIALAGP